MTAGGGVVGHDMSDATSPAPAATHLPAGWYVTSPVEVNHTAPVPRRIRAVLAGDTVLDTVRARYVWEHPYYPAFYIPAADVRADLLIDDGVAEDSPQGVRQRRSIVVGDERRDGAAAYLADAVVPGLEDHYRVEWDAMDAWFEEDEEVVGHPRSPYVRVDALRANRHVRVEKDGVLLAEADSAVAVVETGLPTRWYLDKSAVQWAHLRASDTRTLCPYKGWTSGYWSVLTPGGTHPDLAWSYAYPTRQLAPIAGLVCFYDEHVEQTVDGVATA